MSTSAQQPPNFIDCLLMTIHWPGFIEEYDRLEGSHLAQLARRSPIDQMVDEATGYANAEVAKFIKFVKGEVWDRYPGPRRGVTRFNRSIIGVNGWVSRYKRRTMRNVR